MENYIGEVAPVLTRWGMDMRKRGTAALLCCACRARELAALGIKWTAAEIVKEYAEYLGCSGLAVYVNMRNALRHTGLTPAAALAKLAGREEAAH